MLRKKINRILIGLLFLELSLFFLIFPSPQEQSVLQNPIKIDQRFQHLEKSTPPPTRIIIPSQKIDLPIVEAKIINGYWEISETSASHGVGSANPKEKGNIVIFAHAREGLFYNLKDIKEDDEIQIFTKEGLRKYTVFEILSVYPDQIEVIRPTKNETLTLYTCTGFADEKRLIVKALPMN